MSGSVFPFWSVLAWVIGTLTLSLATLALGQMEARHMAESRECLASWTEIDLEEDVRVAVTERRGRIPAVLVD